MEPYGDIRMFEIDCQNQIFRPFLINVRKNDATPTLYRVEKFDRTAELLHPLTVLVLRLASRDNGV